MLTAFILPRLSSTVCCTNPTHPPRPSPGLWCGLSGRRLCLQCVRAHRKHPSHDSRGSRERAPHKHTSQVIWLVLTERPRSDLRISKKPPRHISGTWQASGSPGQNLFPAFKMQSWGTSWLSQPSVQPRPRSRSHSSSPASDSVLTAQSLELLRLLSPSLTAPLPLSFCVSLPQKLKKKN